MIETAINIIKQVSWKGWLLVIGVIGLFILWKMRHLFFGGESEPILEIPRLSDSDYNFLYK